MQLLLCPVVVIFLGLDWWNSIIYQLVNMHILNTFPIYLMFLLPTLEYLHLLEANKTCKCCANIFIMSVQ